MLNSIDCISGLIFLILFWQGYSKGFFKTILGPIVLVLCSVLSFYYFQQTKNIIGSLIIGTLGPIIIGIIYSMLSKTFNFLTDQDVEPGFISRMLGGCLNLSWGGGIVILFLLLIMILPKEISRIAGIQSKIQKSWIYTIIYTPFNKILNQKDGAEKQNPIKFLLMQDQTKLKELAQHKEFRELLADSRLRRIFSDSAIQQQIQNKEFDKLMTNPKILTLVQDTEFVQKIMGAYTKILNSANKPPVEAELTEEALSLTP